MANESTNNAKKEKFIGLLHQLFQLNQPELDFGLYRIMHAKSDQIKAFIQNDLASEIDEAFADSGDDKIAELKAAYDNELENAKKYNAPDPHAVDAVKGAKEAYHAARDNGDDPSDIYDHLYRFFSRYYDKGDFLSRRYHVGENESRAAPYAVPYDGREVYLHWANKDQYYIKSSEYLSNFSFDLSEAVEKERRRQGTIGQEGFNFGSPDSGNPIKVTLQLVDATEGAHNNVKENQTRFFIIHADKPIKVRPLVSAEGKSDGHELIINFEYRPDPQKSGQDSGWQKKRLQEAESAILEAIGSEEKLKPLHDALTFLAPTEKQKDRSILAKYLTSYTARNTMDYFIHKDLGGFLRRELDFYIKNEIMRLDDLSSDDIAGVTHSLKKITALRGIARQIIDFLAQLENFQKKLWLKKKFVTEVNYCITLDRVPESFLEEILANHEQWREWHKLGFLETPTPSLEILHTQSFMMLDTGLFDDSFKERLLAEIDDLDEQCDGTLFEADNFQALKFCASMYREKIGCVYIDPPYNTGEDFVYKDSYRHSSWLSMMSDRLQASTSLLNKKAAIFTSLDDNESAHFRLLGESLFTTSCFVGNAAWKKTSGSNESEFSHVFDNTFIFKSSSEIKIGKIPRSEDQLKLYTNPDSDPKGAWASSDYTCKWSPTQRPNLAYEIINPFTGERVRPKDKAWRYSEAEHQKNTKEGRVWWGKNGELKVPRYKRYLSDVSDGVIAKSIWDDIETNQKAKSMLSNIGFGEDVFQNPKPVSLVERCLHISSADIAIDYFAGSGTTGNAVINLNRQDGKKRKYILIEMGQYFDSVLIPRLSKVVFSSKWKDGVPTCNESGISHCFKYIRLESYEDSLNNLNLSGSQNYEPHLESEDNKTLRKDFYLNYFLDVETRGSSSLLNVEQFRDPTAYTLILKKPGFDAQVRKNVDLVETFNWLIGLEVSLLDKPRTYKAEFEREHDSELSEDQNTRLKVTRFKEDETGSHWFRVIEGYLRLTPGNDADKEKVMVIWRKMTDNPEQDAAALEALLSKYHVNQSDSEYDRIFINGPHGLSLVGQAKAKLMSLEETFMARMWEDADGAMH